MTETTTIPDIGTAPFDLILFAGQSNMSGRGDAKETHSDGRDAGWEYKPISAPGQLFALREPFGLGEDVPGGLDDTLTDGSSKRRGSLVCAFCEEYHRLSGHQVLAVSASKGGSDTEQWLQSLLPDARNRLNQTLQFLAQRQLTPAHHFVVWCQGETDADRRRSPKDYLDHTNRIFKQLRTHGAEHFFIIQIGHYNASAYPEIRNGLTGMRDLFHYYQPVYDQVGRTAATIAANYVRANR